MHYSVIIDQQEEPDTNRSILDQYGYQFQAEKKLKMQQRLQKKERQRRQQ